MDTIRNPSRDILFQFNFIFSLLTIWYKQDVILSVKYKILNVQDKYKIKNKMSVCLSVCWHVCTYACLHMDICMGPRGFGDLGRRAIYFQGAEEHW